MKKRIMMLMMVAALAVAGIAGCGKKEEAQTNTPAVNQQDDAADAGNASDADDADDASDTTPADTQEEEEPEAPANDKPSLVDWYTANESEFRSIEDQVNATDMGCTLALSVVDENVLVFCYTLDEEFPADEESLATLSETYDQMFEGYTSTFEELCDEIKGETSEETVVIRLVAANPDGTELYSKDFSK